MDNNAQGPVNESQLYQLQQEGKISANTQVQREGSEAWIPLSDALNQSDSNHSIDNDSVAACSMCKKFFLKEDMMHYENHLICSNCKPEFNLKLKEGTLSFLQSMENASIGRRFGAVLIDSLIIFTILGILMIPVGMIIAANVSSIGILNESSDPNAMIPLILSMGGIYLFLFTIPMAYETILVGTKGATFGKMAVGISVVKADGSKVPMLHSFGRMWRSVFLIRNSYDWIYYSLF